MDWKWTRMERIRSRAAPRLGSISLIVQLILILSGLLFLLTGLALIFYPVTFFNRIGNFPPFNRHYEGDLGSFLVPLGIGLLVASRDPERYRAVVGVAAGGSLLHALNHWYDAILGGASLPRWLSDTFPLLLFGLLLSGVFVNLLRAGASGGE